MFKGTNGYMGPSIVHWAEYNSKQRDGSGIADVKEVGKPE
jgi:hypothetical protein